MKNGGIAGGYPALRGLALAILPDGEPLSGEGWPTGRIMRGATAGQGVTSWMGHEVPFFGFDMEKTTMRKLIALFLGR